MMVDQGHLRFLIDAGFERSDAQQALIKYNGDLSKAVVLLSGEVPEEDDLPPSLVSPDEPPPYGPEPFEFPDQSMAPRTPPPSRPEPPEVIDLCSPEPNPPQLLLEAPPDDDLEKALKASMIGTGIGGGGLSVEDEEVSKAMEASMVSLQSADEDQGVRSMKPEKRRRLDSTRPVVLRSLSPVLSGLAAYLQCLYAVPIWRKQILDFRPSEDEMEGCEGRRYTGFWSGSAVPIPANLRNLESNTRLVALQRLFAIMLETTRSFVHISEMVEALEVREFEWRMDSDWVPKVKEYHERLIHDLIACTTTKLTIDVASLELEESDMRSRIDSLEQNFTGYGRQAPNDGYLSLPLPHADAVPFSVLDVTILSRPDTFFAALDRQLISTHSGDVEVFSLLTKLPRSLVLRFSRDANGHSVLLGDADERTAAQEEEARGPFRLEERIWLDRYVVKNRKQIQEAREVLKELKKKEAAARKKRDVVKWTKDGRDGLELIRTTLRYLEEATSSEPERAARQKMLARKYVAILASAEQTVQECDAEIAALVEEQTAVFDNPSMKRFGPYNLVAFIMRNGLNGRGSAWSVVRDDEERWWKIVELEQTEVKLSEVLEDKGGMLNSAGVTMAFYQLEDELIPDPIPPPFLSTAVRLDNDEFAKELSGEQWTDFHHFDPSDEAMVVPLKSSVSDEGGSYSNYFEQDEPKKDELESQTPMSLASEPGSREDSGRESPMTVDEEMGEIPDEDAEVENLLRLRGGRGGPDEPGFGDGDEDEDGYDEDEVELGTLAPMSNGWNVDRAVGKVGGLPRWLIPTSPLRHEDVQCGVCGSSLSLLLQLNSPDDTRPHAAARTLYVFVCRNPPCRGKGKDVKALRIQTSSPNAFFPPTPESEARRTALEAALDPASNLVDASPTPVKPFPEWDITAEPEPYEESYLAEPAADGLAYDNDAEDAAEPDSAVGVDGAFLKFQERVSRLPQQVLRFYRLPDVEEPEPLWVSSSKVSPSSVPACPLCGDARQVEFQILSTLLSYLEDDEFTFDSLLIYTCRSNCAIPNSGWADEFVAELSFAADGVRLGQGSNSS